MQLDVLKKRRLPDAETVFPISEAEMIARYEGVFTAAVNDVLREMGYVYQTLPHTIQGITLDMRTAGFAFTLKGSKNLYIEDEMPDRAKMLDAITPYSIAVWDTSQDDESAQWGEVMSMAAMKRGCRGAVVDGGVRDTDRIIAMKFPVFARYRTSNAMMGRFRMIGYQLPIRIGTVDILPGDVIMADMDGVIVVPRKLAMEVLERAEAIRDQEKGIKKMVNEGLGATEIVDRGGYF